MRITILFMTFLMALTSFGADSVKPRVLDGINVPVANYPAVVQISNAEGGGTGVLIDSIHVLTAAHVVLSTATAQVLQETVKINGSTLTVAPTAIAVNPTYSPKNQVVTEGQLDAAILTLPTAVTNVFPIPILSTAPATPGFMVVFAGYGYEGTITTGLSTTFPAPGTLDVGVARIDNVTSTFFKWNYQPGESAIGQGDSGGPVFILENNVPYVAAIITANTVPNTQGALQTGTRADVLASWISTVVGPPVNLKAPTPNPVINSIITAMPTSTELQVNFSITASDPNGGALTYLWDFGDGVTQGSLNNPGITHTYAAGNTYRVGVTVFNGIAAASSVETVTVISVGSPFSDTFPSGSDFTVVNSTLPPGIFFDQSKQKLSGVAFKTGTYNIAFTSPSHPGTPFISVVVTPRPISTNAIVHGQFSEGLKDTNISSLSSSKAAITLSGSLDISKIGPNTPLYINFGDYEFDGKLSDGVMGKNSVLINDSDNGVTIKAKWSQFGIQISLSSKNNNLSSIDVDEALWFGPDNGADSGPFTDMIPLTVEFDVLNGNVDNVPVNGSIKYNSITGSTSISLKGGI